MQADFVKRLFQLRDAMRNHIAHPPTSSPCETQDIDVASSLIADLVLFVGGPHPDSSMEKYDVCQNVLALPGEILLRGFTSPSPFRVPF